MKSAFRNGYFFTLSRSLNPNIPSTLFALHLIPPHSPPSISSPPFRSVSPIAFMAGGELHALPPLEKQFEDFRAQLEESGTLRDRIRAVVMEIESTTRLIHSGLLLVHQSRSTPGTVSFLCEMIVMRFWLLARYTAPFCMKWLWFLWLLIFVIVFCRLKQRFWRSRRLKLLCWRSSTIDSLKLCVKSLGGITG